MGGDSNDTAPCRTPMRARRCQAVAGGGAADDVPTPPDTTCTAPSSRIFTWEYWHRAELHVPVAR